MQTRIKISSRLKGNKNFAGHTFTEKTKRLLARKTKAWWKKHKIRPNGNPKLNVEKCHARILKEMVEFSRNGYRCVPTGGKVGTDFIAIKNDKVVAVEVEFRQNGPNYSKYDLKNRKYFDDVIWIVRKYERFRVRKSRLLTKK